MKRFAITLVVLLALGALAQQAKPPAQPVYPSIVYSIDATGALVALEGQTLNVHRHYRVLGLAGWTNALVADGQQSAVRLKDVAGKPEFAIRFETTTDPMEYVHLVRLQAGDRARVLPMSEFNGWGFVTKATPQSGAIDVSAAKYGPTSFRLVPMQALAPGEYCFLLGSTAKMGKKMGASCFGVDAEKPESK